MCYCTTEQKRIALRHSSGELRWVEHSTEPSVTASAVLIGQESSNGAYNGPQERSRAERDVRAPQLQYNIH